MRPANENAFMLDVFPAVAGNIHLGDWLRTGWIV